MRSVFRTEISENIGTLCKPTFRVSKGKKQFCRKYKVCNFNLIQCWEVMNNNFNLCPKKKAVSIYRRYFGTTAATYLFLSKEKKNELQFSYSCSLSLLALHTYYIKFSLFFGSLMEPRRKDIEKRNTLKVGICVLPDNSAQEVRFLFKKISGIQQYMYYIMLPLQNMVFTMNQIRRERALS